LDKIERYIEWLLANSTPDKPIWNIEKIRQGKKSGWNYIDGCMIKAVMEMYTITKDRKYFGFADGFVDAKVFDDGSIDGYDVSELNLDNINAGKTLFELYDITKKEKYLKAIKLIYSQIELMPRTKSGNFWHKNIYPNQVWLDGLYMCQPFYMEYERRFNDSKNVSDIFNQFKNVIKNMRDEKTGLYYHAFDESREMFWCDKTTGLSKNFWLRAIGWYSMALIDTYEKCRNMEEASFLKDAYVDLMKSLVKFQSDEGMWYQVVDKGEYKENYLETSGSAILAYSILKGVRMGILDECFTEVGKKAFYGICKKYLSTDEDGNLHLSGICLVAGLGGKDMRDGSFEYYMSEPVVSDDAKGVGPFLLAYTEMRRIGDIEI
jgi:unsaturated rhamnogalacturonyl hydrolase